MSDRRILLNPSVARSIAAVLVACALQPGCSRSADPPPAPAADELAWARAALERNPRLEVLAVDSEAKLLTVRDLQTGEVQAVGLGELAAVPLSGLQAPSALPAAQQQAPAPDPLLPAEPPAPEDPAFAAAPDSAPAPAATGQLDYTVERDDQGIRVTGPGLSIVSAGASAASSARGEAGQQSVDPVICEGRRMMQFDNRRIFVDGDAITARGGCELHITNSRIVASGSGVVVRDASVHISNSYIEGGDSAYDAGPGARLFLRGTTLSGVRRRDAAAEVRELVGGEFIPSR